MSDIHSYNYRVMRHPNGEYAIHEVFYDAQGRIETWTAMPLSVVCESAEALRTELEKYSAAFDRPPVDFVPAKNSG